MSRADTYQSPEDVNTPVTRWWAYEILKTLKQARNSYGDSAIFRLLRGVGKQKKDKGAGVLSTDRGWTEEMVKTFLYNFSKISGPIMERHSIGVETEEYEKALEKLMCKNKSCTGCDICDTFEKEREELIDNKFVLQAGTTDRKMFQFFIEKLEAMGIEPPEQIDGHKKETKAHVVVPFKIGDKLKKNRMQDIPYSLPVGRSYSVAELRELCIHLELTEEYKAGCEKFFELSRENNGYYWDSLIHHHQYNSNYEKMLICDTIVMYRTSYKGKSTGYVIAYLKDDKIIMEQHERMSEAPVYNLEIRYPKTEPVLKNICKFQVKKIPMNMIFANL